MAVTFSLLPLKMRRDVTPLIIRSHQFALALVRLLLGYHNVKQSEKSSHVVAIESNSSSPHERGPND